jgi:glutamate/aspartate transport system substrate-binding protein
LAILKKSHLSAFEGTKMLRCVSLLLALFVSVVPASSQTQIPSDGRLKSIIENKTIRIAYRTDASPFSLANDKGEPAGYSLDLCQLVTKSIAAQFGVQDLKIEWVPVNVQTRFTAVSSGKADLECGSSTVTLGRMKEVDFSNIIFVESTGVVVSRASNIQRLADLSGKKIAVISGTTNQRAVADLNQSNNLNIALVTVTSRDEGLAALEGGKVDGYASDKLLLIGNRMKNPEAYLMLPDDLSIEAYGIVLPRGDWSLRLAVNTGLAQIYRSGQIIEIYKRWFEPIGLPPNVLMRAAIALGALSD